MKNVPDNELLSAYVDGELTAEERAQVERLLAAHPEARQLVEELRALSSSLQDLPSHRIGEDISEQVLRRAERRMLSEPGADGPGDRETAAPEGPFWAMVLRRVAKPRTLAWSGIAVAVAILLFVMQSDRLPAPRERTIAMKEAPADTDASGPALEAFERPSEESRGIAEEMAADEPASVGLPVRELRSSAPEMVAGKLHAPEGVPARAQWAAPATPLAVPAPESAPEMARPSKAGAVGGGAGVGYGGLPGLGSDAGRQVADDNGRAAPPGVARRGQFKGRPSQPTEEAKLSDSVAGPAAGVDMKAKQNGYAGQGPEPLLVVWCDVTNEALRQQVFQGLLEKEEIAEAMSVAAARGRANVVRDTLVTDVDASEPITLHAVVAKPSAPMYFDIEATPEQIKALLTDLEERSRQIASVTYTLSPGAISPPFEDFSFKREMARQAPVGGLTQQAGEPGADAQVVRQKLSRIEVDRLLAIVNRQRAGDDLRRDAELREAVGLKRLPAALSSQAEGRPADAPSQAQITQQTKDAGRGATETPAPLAARPGQPGARAFGAGMQPAPPPGPAVPAEPPAAAPLAEAAEPPPPRADRPEPMMREAEETAAKEAKGAPEKGEPEAQEELLKEPRIQKGVARVAAEPAQRAHEKAQAPPQEMQQPRPAPEAESRGRELDLGVARYRVQVVFRVVKPDGPHAAAVLAKDAVRAGIAAEAAAEVDAREMPAEKPPPPAAAVEFEP